MDLLLHNPHSVLAALETRPADVINIHLPASAMSDGDGPAAEGRDAWLKVQKLARSRGVSVQSNTGRGPKGGDGGRAAGASATVRPRNPISIHELFSEARERNEGKGLWLALDTLQDPHNLGAIFRTAAFFGVQGILLTADRSAPISGTAYDVACGGLEHVPFAQGNLQQAFEVAKEAGMWILGTSEHAHDDFRKIAVDRPWLLVLGNEEKGMRRLTEESCDVLCQIRPLGAVGSLNVAVAAGILISKLSTI